MIELKQIRIGNAAWLKINDPARAFLQYVYDNKDCIRSKEDDTFSMVISQPDMIQSALATLSADYHSMCPEIIARRRISGDWLILEKTPGELQATDGIVTVRIAYTDNPDEIMMRYGLFDRDGVPEFSKPRRVKRRVKKDGTAYTQVNKTIFLLNMFA